MQDPLAQFDPFMVDNRHRELLRLAFEWSIEHAGTPDPGEHAKQAFLASTFGLFCQPPDATLEESFHSLKFLLIVFKTDDAPPEVLEAFIPHLGGRPDGDPPRGRDPVRSCYDQLIADLGALGRDTAGFQEALRDMCVSMQVEKRADKAAMSEEEFADLRKKGIAVPAFIEVWRTIRGISLSPAITALIQSSRIGDIASEIAYLANDIGSLDKDEKVQRADAQSVDLNLALRLMRSLGSRDAALDAVIRLHNARITDFRDAERALLSSEHGADPNLRAYVTLLRATVEGNLATTKHLVPIRYRGAAEPLSRLTSL